MHSLALLYVKSNRVAKAEPTMTVILEIKRRLLGNSDGTILLLLLYLLEL
jgi:hypothetical protein